LSQASADHRNCAQARLLKRNHIQRMRKNTIAPSAGASSEWRTKMQVRIAKTLRGALLPAVAALSLFAAIPAAQADQQQTTAQLDNAQNWGVAGLSGMSGAHAQAVRQDFRRYR
jgi:hypothetical protein